ncbi:MAG: redoxin domain-containing protein [Acidimicrobiales bacterium]|nr:redoxin domain-containing protein [Acidimicrobiales bacterium]
MSSKQTKRARREAARRARQRRRRIRWRTAAALTILAVTGIVLFSAGSDDQAGALAPDFELETPDGETVRLSDYRGRPVAVTFMHTD